MEATCNPIATDTLDDMFRKKLSDTTDIVQQDANNRSKKIRFTFSQLGAILIS